MLEFHAVRMITLLAPIGQYRTMKTIAAGQDGFMTPHSTSGSASLRLEVLEDETALHELAAHWEDLLARAERPEPMLSPAWAIAWWRHYSEGRSLAIGAFYRGDKLVGLAPLCRRRFAYPLGLSMLRLEIMGCSGGEPDGVWGEYLGVLVAKGFEREVAEAFARALSNGAFGPWDELVMELMDGGSVMSRELTSSLEKVGRFSSSVEMRAHFLPLPENWDAFLQSVHSKRRTWFRRTWKDFVAWAEPEGYALERATRAEEIGDHMRILAELHRERWQASGQQGAFVSPRFTAFHADLAQRLLERGQLELCRLSVGGKPIAALYSFLAGNKIYFYQSGRKMEDVPRHVRLGIVMFMLALQDAMARGIQEWDFLGGDSAYKSYFTHLARPLVTMRVARPGWREAARASLYASARRVRRLLRRSIPNRDVRNSNQNSNTDAAGT